LSETFFGLNVSINCQFDSSGYDFEAYKKSFNASVPLALKLVILFFQSRKYFLSPAVKLQHSFIFVPLSNFTNCATFPDQVFRYARIDKHITHWILSNKWKSNGAHPFLYGPGGILTTV